MRKGREREEGGEIACHYIFTSISLLSQIDRKSFNYDINTKKGSHFPVCHGLYRCRPPMRLYFTMLLEDITCSHLLHSPNFLVQKISVMKNDK
jgi:hypothetical protein